MLILDFAINGFVKKYIEMMNIKMIKEFFKMNVKRNILNVLARIFKVAERCKNSGKRKPVKHLPIANNKLT